jgi:NADH-quinone oxidoreductase subunit G
VRRLVQGEDDRLLLRADKGANARGAAWIFGPDADEARVWAAVAAGKVTTVLVLGDTLDAADTAAPPPGVSVELLFVGPFALPATSAAAVAIPSASWSEADGTFVNFEGHVQRVRRCHLPFGEARPGWRIAADVAAVQGLELPAWTDAGDVLRSLADGVKGFEGITAEALGLLGLLPSARVVPSRS